jgi:MFS family permease
VGLAYSFVFLLTPLQVLSTALLPRYGFKKIMMSGWTLRSVFLAIPLLLALLAPVRGSPWMVAALVWSVFFFCLFRAIGSSAIVPWLYAILPPGTHGRYFSSDQFLSGLAGVGTLVLCSVTFALLPIYAAFGAQYLVALLGSFAANYALQRLPDAPRPTALDLRKVLVATPRHMFAPSRFRGYLALNVWFALVTTPIPPFSAYYLKVATRLPPYQIILFTTVQYAGVIIGAWFMRTRIDRTGAKPFLQLALALYAALAVYWWFFLGRGAAGAGWLPLVYFLMGVAGTIWFSANLHYLPKVVPEHERTLMVSIHGAVTAFLGGLSPVVWGLFLEGGGTAPSINPAVFRLYFAVLLVGACLLAVAVARLKEQMPGAPPLFVGSAILRPFRGNSYLASLINPGTPETRGKSEKRVGQDEDE